MSGEARKAYTVILKGTVQKTMLVWADSAEEANDTAWASASLTEDPNVVVMDDHYTDDRILKSQTRRARGDDR